MTIAEWLVDSMVRLQNAGVMKGRTDCLVLLADLFDKDKSWIHAHPEQELNGLQLKELDYKLEKRIKRLPLSYIRGFSEFYGRKFTVNSKVLIPRPESESFIDILKSLQVETARVADIGTGSGILGITAALEMPDAKVDLYDVDEEALAVARHNAAMYGLRLDIIKSDLLDALSDTRYDVMLANLPYVPDGMVTSPEIEEEPALALFSGEKGLSHYRKFWRQVSDLAQAKKPSYILTEALEYQHEDVQKLAGSAGYELQKTEVLVQLFYQS